VVFLARGDEPLRLLDVNDFIEKAVKKRGVDICNMMSSATIITLANEMPAGYLTAAAYVQLDHTRYTRFVRTSR
jgi:hypothetical protein